MLKEDGSVWTTGWNEDGQVGDGTITDKSEFNQVIDKGAVAIAAGHGHSMVMKKDGSVWATGHNDKGQLGDGTTTNKSEFTQVIDEGAVAIAAGGKHSMVCVEERWWCVGRGQ